jgi:hypothetical protein
MNNEINPLQLPINRENGGIVDSINFEEACWSCTDSYNRDYDSDKRTYFKKDEPPSMKNDSGGCDICNGSGLVLTEAGNELIDFIKRRM